MKGDHRWLIRALRAWKRSGHDAWPDPDDVTSLADDGVAGELGELTIDHVFGALWTRPGLDRRSRSLVTLAR